ncbi:M20 family peptidase [Aestuariibacter halophilus]|uniref:M20 family peptidase n=1 Tax=Fluctibacter halophilus TaxID=226011 RepID=A0ABS8G964_9ALTE|nr:M20 family peptidase [Aestuariibacter halophilus]MCC2616983.1 M20 family peptidase [Aestuariibacter halophilus]
MKKIMLLLVLAVSLALAVAVVRTFSYYGYQQVSAEPQIAPIDIDMQAATQRFAKALTFATISHDDPSKVDTQAFTDFHRFLATAFPLVHQQANPQTVNEHSLVFSVQGSDTSLQPALFMGHMDVVPVDDVTREQWQHDPFGGVIANDIVWGRGAMDDKVTVMALLESLEYLLRQGVQPKRTVYFAFGHDEEVGGEQGAKAIAETFAQQGIRFAFVLDEGGAVTDGLMQGIQQPVAIVGVAEKGFVNVKMTVNAEGGHSSQPPDHTAAGILASAIVKVENAPFETDLQFTRMTFDRVGQHAGFGQKLAMANLWLLAPLVEATLLGDPNSAASIRTTTAVTMLSGSSKSNILPTEASAVVNLRTMPGVTTNDVIAHLQQAIDDPRVTLTPFMANEASPVSSTDTLGYRLIEKTIRRIDSNVLVAPYMVRGGTDAKHFYPLSDQVYRFMMVTLTPESLPRFHGINEQLAVADYERAIRFFHALLMATAMGDGDA